MEIGAFLSSFHLLPAKISIRHTPDTDKPAQVGLDGRTHCVSFVGRGVPWYTSCHGVKQHSPKEDTGGTMTRCSWHSLTPRSRRNTIYWDLKRYHLLSCLWGAKATNHNNKKNQTVTKGPIINEGRPGWKIVFPPDYPANPEARVVLWSEVAKKIILIELSVPWEEGCEQAFERKAPNTRMAGMAVPSWGRFPAQLVWRMLTTIGMTERERKAAGYKMEEAAKRASCWLWSRREELSWKPGGEDIDNGFATTASPSMGRCGSGPTHCWSLNCISDWIKKNSKNQRWNI